MKYRPTRKNLTHEQANQIFQNCQQGIQAETENIFYWEQRRGQHLKPIDTFILMTDKFFLPEEAIKASEERINYLSDKLSDMRRFFDPEKEVLKIF